MGRKRLLADTEHESSFSNCNVEYEIIDERQTRRKTADGSYFQNNKEHRIALGRSERLHNPNEKNGNNFYGLRSGSKMARIENPEKLSRETHPTRRSLRIENRALEENFQLHSQRGRQRNTTWAIEKENNEKHQKDGAIEDEKREEQPQPEQKEEETGRSSKEEEEEDEDDEQQLDSAGEENESSQERYSFRRNRQKSVKTMEHRRPIRGCRLRARSVPFGSDICKKYKKSFDAAVLHRLPSNPVLDRQRTKDEKRHHRRRKFYRCSSSSSSSSSNNSHSDSSASGGMHSMRKDLADEARFERRKLNSLLKGRHELMPINLSDKDIQTNLAQIAREKIRLKSTKSSCADIDPMQIELGTGFKQVGGLTQHIQSLKEVVLFPMLYPHLFERFKIQPPKGILFYGAPGTGKTLVARALAQECGKIGAGKIAFFMRKGADCLSKWVGESERQLRLLFDQAFRMRPSIIFFDEIDGLAPVRSSRQDQIHSSIVSTLLALMDGLDSRGEVVVIGATNRLDSIDPALRRPGRFDRELSFDLPDKTARHSILKIHTEQWGENCPDAKMLSWLSEQTSGYCGADLRALCTESVLIAMRDCFPHMYISSEKLDLDPAKIRVKKSHFSDALKSIKPSAKRDSLHSQIPGHCCRISFIDPVVDQLLSKRLPSGYLNRRNLDTLYKTELERVVMALKMRPIVPNARLLLHGRCRLGQTTHFLPVLVNRIDHLPLFCLSVETIFAGPGTSEENISQIIGKALRTVGQHGSAQALVLLPDLDLLETILPIGTWKMLIASLNAFSGFISVLLLASVQQLYTNCSEDIKQLFCSPNSLIEINRPKRKTIENYFNAILEDARNKPVQIDLRNYPTPPKAKIEIVTRKFTAAECKQLDNDFQQMLRQFRIFLRDLLRQIIREPRFKYFNLPVTKNDAEDYYEIIKNPMCLSQMMTNIDAGQYSSKDAFMKDIHLIRYNAIEYNPDTNMESKQIRHAANSLVDMTEALFSMEMDDDFPNKIEEARKLVEESKRWMENESAKDTEKGGEERGHGKNVTVADKPREDSGDSDHNMGMSMDGSEGHSGRRASDESPPPTFVLDLDELWNVVQRATDKARICSWGVPQIECLGAELCQIIDQYRGEWDRSELTVKMVKCVDDFEL